MADTFDAYHRWLGIPPHEQPPNHYRLLGVQLFEDSPEVIEAAADRQMGHLRTYQTGAHAELSQRPLNEVSAARVCLLNPNKKAAYDQALRQDLEARTGAVPRAEPQQVAASPWANPVEESSSLPEFGERFPSASARSVTRSRPTHSQVLLVAAMVGVVLLLGLVLWGLNAGNTAAVAPHGTAESPGGTGRDGLPGREELRHTAAQQPLLPGHPADAGQTLTALLNDFAQWKVAAGKWTSRDNKIIGSGNCGLSFNRDLPADFRLTFKMNVLSGMRPRVRFRGFYLGNEGYNKKIFVFGTKAEGTWFAYRNGQELQVSLRIQDGNVALDIDGKRVATAKIKPGEPQRISLSGGDGWSRGSTAFYDFEVTTAPDAMK